MIGAGAKNNSTELLRQEFEVIAANGETFRLLKNEAESGNISHCYLFLSQDALALDILAKLFVSKIIGADKDSLLEKRLAGGNLPDVMDLPAEGDKVLVRDTELLSHSVYLTPVELERKFYIISKAETMTEAAQNKLLKILEEPPSSAVIILKAASADALLPTVRSRCRIFELMPHKMALIEAAVDSLSLPPVRKELVLAAGLGRFDMIERMYADPVYFVLFDLVFGMLENMKKSGDILKHAYELLRYKDYMLSALLFIECILHDCMVYSIDKTMLYFRSKQDNIERMSKDYPPEAVISLLPKLERARERIRTNGNITAITDELLFSLLEVKTKWQKL